MLIHRLYLFVFLSLAICPSNAMAGPRIIMEYQGKKHPWELIPKPYVDLFSLLSSPIHKESNVDSITPAVAYAQKEGMRWIKRVIDPAWWPPPHLSIIFIRDEHDGVDVMQCQWETNRFLIQVAQTATLFALKITPLRGSGLGQNVHENIEEAKRICVHVFNRSGERRTSQGRVVRIPNLSRKIATYLFNDGVVYVQSDQTGRYLVGRGQTAREARARRPRDEKEYLALECSENADWEKSAMAWRYWFRMVHWWSDGRVLGFYFPKDEAGPRPSGGSMTIDRKWF